MPFTVDTPISGIAAGSADAFHRWAVDRGCLRQDDVRSYLDTVYDLAPKLNLNPDIVVVQSVHETSQDGAPWASAWWQRRCNPAGIGITGDPAQNEASRDFGNGVAGARAQLLHLHLYAHGSSVPAGFSTSEDPRWDAALAAGFVGIARTLNDLTNRWAIDNGYATKIAARLNDLERAAILVGSLPEPERGPLRPSRKPYVLLVAGHRSVGDGGNPVERELTDDLARAYLQAFRAEGYETDWFQEVDNDDNPTMTKGGLDGLALGVGRRLAARSDDLILLLDLHFNMSESAVHVVVPHNRRQDGRDTLNTAYVQGRVAEDIADNNPLDVKLAEAIAREVATIPGMRLMGAGRSGVAGVMLENETGVGNADGSAPDNARLAIMAATAPFRMSTVRLTIEHGGTNDASKPDFFNRSAQAALRAVNKALADRIDQSGAPPTDETEEEHEHEAEEALPIPSLAAFLFGAVDVYAFNPDGAVSRLWLRTGNESGRFPRLMDVLTDGDTRYFAFSDGSVIKTLGEGVEYLTRLP